MGETIRLVNREGHGFLQFHMSMLTQLGALTLILLLRDRIDTQARITSKHHQADRSKQGIREMLAAL